MRFMYSSAMFIPPVKAVTPSTTSILRWSRLLKLPLSTGISRWKTWHFMPHSCIALGKFSGRRLKLPKSSYITLTSTPAAALRFNLLRMPSHISPSAMMKYSR